MGFEHFKIGKAGAPFRHGAAKAKRDAAAPDPSCASGAFYTSPTLGETVDASEPLNIVWQPSLNCLSGSPTYVDIYLDNPGAASPRLHLWQGVPYAPGNYTVNMSSGWWNSSSSASLQLMVVPTGTPPFLSMYPAGPVFEATSNGSTPVSGALASGATTVVTATTVSGISSHKLSKGKTAAAVLLPLLFVILLGLAYVKISRMRGSAKRSEWSEKLDKRMSTISADWKSITPGGAKEAVRQSMAQRNSSAFSFGAIRPGNVDGEPVIMGEKPAISRGSIDVEEKDLPRTSLGSGVGVGVGARRPRTHATPPDRGSRAVSFADTAHPRPSMSSAYSRGSRAFHTASTYNDFADSEAPPVPALPSPSRISAYGTERKSSETSNNNRVSSVYNGNGTAWSSGERVQGVDGGYGAQAVSPTGRVHTINYPSAPGHDNFSYGNATEGSYFSPTTPTPSAAAFGVYEPSHDSAYAATTFGEYTQPKNSSPSESEISSGLPSAMTSPRQTAGPLTLTSEDIRRRMASGHSGDSSWRQSVDEVFGALSMMRTGAPTSPEAEDDNGEYLFAPVQETVFAYPGTPAVGSFNPGTPAASSFNSTASALSSPFAMPMSAPMASPDEMLRQYASKHASTATAQPSPLSGSTAGAEVVSGIQNTGMRILFAQPDAAPAPARRTTLLRAGKGARFSK